MDSSYNYSAEKKSFIGTQFVWYIVSIFEVLLAFRLVLKLMGANPEAEFSSFIYSTTEPFVAPFLSVFPVAAVQTSVLEWATALAMFVYWLIGLGIVKFLFITKSASHHGEPNKPNKEENSNL